MIVSERLKFRLSKVPGVTSIDIDAWLSEALIESELKELTHANAIFYLALAIGYETISADAARYFKYQDGEESVDKSNIFANYKDLAMDARRQYEKYRRSKAVTQIFAKRADGR